MMITFFGHKISRYMIKSLGDLVEGDWFYFANKSENQYNKITKIVRANPQETRLCFYDKEADMTDYWMYNPEYHNKNLIYKDKFTVATTEWILTTDKVKVDKWLKEYDNTNKRQVNG